MVNLEKPKLLNSFEHIENGIPVLGKIPYDKKFVEALVRLEPIVIYDEKYEKLFSGILNKVRSNFR